LPAVLALTFCFGSTPALLAAAPGEAVIAKAGINLPTMGIVYWQAGHDWRWSYDNYFSPAVMSEIRNALGADYVRTGFVPDWLNAERVPWQREDAVMDDACNAGLGVMVIVPIGDDRLGRADLVKTVRAFFDRYTARERGCEVVAEIGNEDNLSTPAQAYADAFNALAPQLRAVGVPAIVAGTSQLDVRWTAAVSRLVAAPAYGFHPYAVRPADMQGAIDEMAGGISGASSDAIWITEYGSEDAATLTSAIAAMDAQPAITVYEYRCQPTDDGCKYGLKDHPALYKAVQTAFAYLHDRQRKTNDR
jgi:hypothetical protein